MLGQLAIRFKEAALRKKAGDADEAPAGFLGQLAAASRASRSSGAYSSPFSIPSSGDPGLLMSPAQVAVGGGQTLFGKAGAGVAGLAAAVGDPILKQWGIDVRRPWRIGYGSDRSANEHIRLSGVLTSRQLQATGASAKNLLRRVADVLPIPKDWIQSIPEQGAGQILAMITPSFPEIQTIMQTLDPNMMTDFTPIVKATYIMNEGQFDERLFGQTLQAFDRAYENGMFGRVPKDIAANAMAYAAERGARGSALPIAATNVARAADALVQRGLAPNFGAAMQLAGMIDESSLPAPRGMPQTGDLPISSRPVKFGSVKFADVMTDPSGVERFAAKLDHMARRGLVNKEQIYQASQVAMQKGINVSQAMQAVAMAGRLRKVLGGGQPAEYYANVAADLLVKTQQSGRVQDLAVLWGTNAKLRPQIEKALANNDQADLNRMLTMARQNPQIRQLRNPQLTQQFMAKLNVNPSAMRGVIRADLTEAVGKNPELTALLKNRGRLIELMRTGDYTRLSPATQKALLRGGDAMLAAGLMFADEASEPAPPPPGVDEPEPLQRIGLPLPSEKGVKLNLRSLRSEAPVTPTDPKRISPARTRPVEFG